MDSHVENTDDVNVVGESLENSTINNNSVDGDFDIENDIPSSKVDKEVRLSNSSNLSNKDELKTEAEETENNLNDDEKEVTSVKTEKPKENVVEPVKPEKVINISPDACEVCEKKVYPMESLMMDSKIYHKTCFRCTKCGKSLSPAVVTKLNDKLFCKPHYIELFRKRGRYEDIENATTNDKVDFDVVNQSYTYERSNLPDTEESNRAQVSAKHLVAQFQEMPESDRSGPRKAQIEYEGCSAVGGGGVAQLTKTWGSNNNSNVSGRELAPGELDSLSKNAPVKNIRSKFEDNQ